MYTCLYILEIWNVKLYDYPELILIFYRLVTFKNLLNTLPSQFHQKSSIGLENTGLSYVPRWQQWALKSWAIPVYCSRLLCECSDQWVDEWTA